ncbi:hypothetical protein V9T40_004612 [Parthenolecanium corni]|uniref:Uncharacterized protein n=1 Tax=Parthenolecanium corni TaxID=536013 RepID=A0AAN9YAK7_9HEMI
MSQRDIPSRVLNEPPNANAQLPLHAPIHSSKSVPSLNSACEYILFFAFNFSSESCLKCKVRSDGDRTPGRSVSRQSSFFIDAHATCVANSRVFVRLRLSTGGRRPPCHIEWARARQLRLPLEIGVAADASEIGHFDGVRFQSQRCRGSQRPPTIWRTSAAVASTADASIKRRITVWCQSRGTGSITSSSTPTTRRRPPERGSSFAVMSQTYRSTPVAASSSSTPSHILHNRTRVT